MIRSFIVGAVTGAAAAWLWGDALRRYLDQKSSAARQYLDARTEHVRARAAGTLQAAAEGLEKARETLEGGLGGRPSGGADPGA